MVWEGRRREAPPYPDQALIWDRDSTRVRQDREPRPEDLLDADYIPSLWSVQKIALLVLVSIIHGPISLAGLAAAGPLVHRNLANAPRKRKPHVRYPVRGLF